MKSGLLKRVDKQQAMQIAVVIVLFMFCRIFSMTVFYEGFIKTFELLNRRLFGMNAPPSLLAHVPYHSGSILMSALKHPVFAGGLVLFYLPFLLKRQISSVTLQSYSQSERYIVFASAFLLAWELSTGDYNYYLDQAFYFDRIALIVLAILLLRYPLLTPLFMAFAFVFRSQFNYQVEGFALPDKRFLFDLLIMFTVVLYARRFNGSFKISFLFFAACIIASNYFMCGAQKIMSPPHGYEWAIYNAPSDLFLNVHYRGWLAKADQRTIDSIYRFLSAYGKYLQALVFIVELGALFALRNRKTAAVIFAASGLMHLGIFMFGSMFFWKLIVIDLLLAFIFFTKKDEAVFPKQLFPASLIVILTSGVWLKPLHIAWWDTPFSQYFTYEVTDVNGMTYELEKNEMDPYQQWFQYDKFNFLVNKPLLMVSGFGYTNTFKLSQEIKQATAVGFFSLEATEGKNKFDLKQKENYEVFIKTYFSNRNKRIDKHFLPRFIEAPQHLYNSAFGAAYHNQARVRLFRVIFNQVYSADGKPEVLTKETVDEIAIPF